MRSSTITPSDVPAEVPCGQPYPYNDLTSEMTCERPLRHEWEHAARIPEHHWTPYARHSEWVWWYDPRKVDLDVEEARLQATAYVAGRVAHRTARATLARRLRRALPFMVIAALLAAYLTLTVNRVYVTRCILTGADELSRTEAVICDWLFPGDDAIQPGQQPLGD